MLLNLTREPILPSRFVLNRGMMGILLHMQLSSRLYHHREQKKYSPYIHRRYHRQRGNVDSKVVGHYDDGIRCPRSKVKKGVEVGIGCDPVMRFPHAGRWYGSFSAYNFFGEEEEREAGLGGRKRPQWKKGEGGMWGEEAIYTFAKGRKQRSKLELGLIQVS
ncbi:hypothetical protein FHL15_008398 [Xylaria flabelliformis]|uniref:Uncharacterized protein n=1 Tax=Xylaria flabelliformis TaxID=2512241 RepID=A0A553HRN5_9PEZI|nr:hypothetical protein FHL15_008398 [Xylaria flabelliformis]